MKKILVFGTAYYPIESGAEIAIKEIIKRTSDFEFDVITARLDRHLSRYERYGSTNIYRVGVGNKFIDKFICLPVLGFLKAVSLHKKNHYCFIWSLMASQAGVAATFFKIKNPDIKLLLTLQEGDEEEYLKRYVLNNEFLYKIFIRPWHILVFRKADYIAAISNYLKARARKNDARCQIEIVPNAVDLKNFKKEFKETELAELKIKLGKKDGDKFIIHTGRLVFKNALSDVIKALAYLPENIKFLSLGKGEKKKELEDLAQWLKLSDRVIFLDFVNHEELPKYLKISDVFVRPSLSEGLGNSFLEAMAADVPIVGTPIGGIPDFLVDGETGLFCEVRNPKSIAEKVKIFLSNAELKNKIISNAKKMVEENYDWDLIAEKMKNIFYKLCREN